MRILGMDTDGKGSIAVLESQSPLVLTLDVYAIPNRVKVLKSGTRRLGIDYPALVAAMTDLTSHASVDHAYLEDQWSRPMQAAPATFTFGQTFGDCRSAIAAGLLAQGLSPSEVDEHMTFIPGKEWKGQLGLDSDKSKALSLATRLFPKCAHAWAKTSLHTSAAEASLLAFYGMSLQGVPILPGAVVYPVKTPICRVLESLVLPTTTPKRRKK